MLGTLAYGPVAADLVLMTMEPGHAPLLRTAGTPPEVIVPMPRRHAAWSELLRMVTTLYDGADIAGFRLLFPAWDADTAARLCSELVKACSDRLGGALRFGGAARVAHEWLRTARAMGEWDLARLPRPQIARTS